MSADARKDQNVNGWSLVIHNHQFCDRRLVQMNCECGFQTKGMERTGPFKSGAFRGTSGSESPHGVEHFRGGEGRIGLPRRSQRVKRCVSEGDEDWLKDALNGERQVRDWRNRGNITICRRSVMYRWNFLTRGR
jgi:hypothetical protein